MCVQGIGVELNSSNLVAYNRTAEKKPKNRALN